MECRPLCKVEGHLLKTQVRQKKTLTTYSILVYGVLCCRSQITVTEVWLYSFWQDIGEAHDIKKIHNISLQIKTCSSTWCTAMLRCVRGNWNEASLCRCVCSDELLDSHHSSPDLADVMEQINNSFPACSRKFPATFPRPLSRCVIPARVGRFVFCHKVTGQQKNGISLCLSVVKVCTKMWFDRFKCLF